MIKLPSSLCDADLSPVLTCHCILCPTFPSHPQAACRGWCHHLWNLQIKRQKIDSKLPMAHLLLTVSQSKSCFPTASWFSHLCEFMTRFLMCSTLLLFSPSEFNCFCFTFGCWKIDRSCTIPSSNGSYLYCCKLRFAVIWLVIKGRKLNRN